MDEVVVTNGNWPKFTMFADLSDTKHKIILDPKVQIVNLEAAEQPEASDLTPDEESDEADKSFCR